MIIARHRRQVIEKIKSNAEQKKFHKKAEIGDPVLSKEQSNALIRKFWANKDKAPYLFFNYLLRGVFNLITPIFSTDVQFRGLENLPHSEHAFITSNHYNQLDVLPIKKLAMRQHRRLFFIINDTNLVMHFPIGLIVRNADTIPINHDLHYWDTLCRTKSKKFFRKKHGCSFIQNRKCGSTTASPALFKKEPTIMLLSCRYLLSPVLSRFVHASQKNGSTATFIKPTKSCIFCQPFIPTLTNRSFKMQKI